MEYVDIEKVKKFKDKETKNKIKLLADVELDRALLNAQGAYQLLIDEEKGEGKLNFRPSEHNEKKHELSLIIDTIQEEQRERLVMKK
jgi:hypothetical protein